MRILRSSPIGEMGDGHGGVDTEWILKSLRSGLESVSNV